jgi:hypothetical protein
MRRRKQSLLSVAMTLAASLSAAGELSGQRVPPFPDGLVNHDGACIVLAGAADRDCRYGFLILDDAAGVHTLLLGAESQGHDDAGKPTWLVIDSFRISPLPTGYGLAYTECAYDGAIDGLVVAAVRRYDRVARPPEWLDEVLWAKRLDLRRRAFEDLPTEHVRCKNVGMG